VESVLNFVYGTTASVVQRLACWPLVPEFAGSNQAEVVGFFGHLKKSSACLPSEGKWKNLSHVPALRHVKEPSTFVNYECASKIPCIVPSFASRGISCLCGAWRLWWSLRGTHWGQGYNRPTGCSIEKAPHATFNIFLFIEQRQLATPLLFFVFDISWLEIRLSGW